jgi:hypothetical protein
MPKAAVALNAAVEVLPVSAMAAGCRPCGCSLN